MNVQPVPPPTMPARLLANAVVARPLPAAPVWTVRWSSFRTPLDTARASRLRTGDRCPRSLSTTRQDHADHVESRHTSAIRFRLPSRSKIRRVHSPRVANLDARPKGLPCVPRRPDSVSPRPPQPWQDAAKCRHLESWSRMRVRCPPCTCLSAVQSVSRVRGEPARLHRVEGQEQRADAWPRATSPVTIATRSCPQAANRVLGDKE